LIVVISFGAAQLAALWIISHLDFIFPDGAQRRSGTGEPGPVDRAGLVAAASGSPIPARALLGRDDDGEGDCGERRGAAVAGVLRESVKFTQ